MSTLRHLRRLTGASWMLQMQAETTDVEELCILVNNIQTYPRLCRASASLRLVWSIQQNTAADF